MNDELIEKMARAICEEDHKGGDFGMMGIDAWEEPRGREVYIARARAALSVIHGEGNPCCTHLPRHDPRRRDQMTEPSEWAMEKARIVYDALETTRECFVGTPAEHRDIAALARALDEARALNTEQEAMLLNQAKTIKEMQAEIEALREALKPFADMCADIERCAAEYPADHPASDPENWFTGSFEWPALLRAKALYEGEIK